MSVLLTVVILGVVTGWVLSVLRRLTQMREEVKVVWKRLEGDRSNEAVRTVYNNHVAKYNQALNGFPGNLVAPLFGFKTAKHF